MYRKVAAVWVSLLIMVSSIVILVEITDRVEAPTTLFVGGGGGGNYTKIQWAIDNASDGDTVFVYNGTYFENVVVDKTINLVGENIDTTIIDGNGIGNVVNINMSWVNITGFTVKGSTSNNAGIILDNTQNCSIEYNNFSMNDGYGIQLTDSYFSNIKNNNLRDNYYGIFLDSSNFNDISNNNAINNDIGISLRQSHGNIIYENIASSNTIMGIGFLESSNNTVDLNNVSSNIGQGIVNSEDSNDNRIANNTILFNDRVPSDDDGGICIWNSMNVTCINNTLVHNGFFIFGIKNAWNSHNIDSTNTVNGKSVYYWRNKNGGTIPPNAGQIILANCTNVIIEGQNIINAGFGISLGYSPYNIIKDSNIYSNSERGIWLQGSNGNTIINNNVSNNRFDGIWMYISSNNNLSNNNISRNRYGIHLKYSTRNTMEYNTFYHNSYYGVYLEDSNINTVNNNNCTSRQSWSRSIFSLNSDEITITNNTVFSISTGIRVHTSLSSQLDNNTVIGAEKGIYISFSYDIILTNNTLLKNDFGIYLERSENVILSNNTMLENGIFIDATDLREWNTHSIDTTNLVNGKKVYYWKNQIGGKVPGNAGQVILSNCTNVDIENQIINGGSCGILLGISTGINITNNTIAKNYFGINLYLSNSNMIFHNNIYKNTNQAYDDGTNLWDNGYPSGGNYWSDYNGIDLNSTASQDVPPPDEIGDTPYIIDSNSKDNYPLISPIGNFTFLSAGWNLISVSFIQPDTNLGNILSSIIGSYSAVQWFDSSDQVDIWKHNSTLKPDYLNDLTDLNHTMGFWIHITKPDGVLFVQPGTQPTSNQTIQLHPGWNMVGYPSLSTHNRTTGLNNLTFDIHIDAIQWYDTGTETWHFMGPDDFFVPGRGYWVHSKVDAEWEVPL